MGDLERELRDLSAWLETPEPPDVRAQVRARLDRPARRWRALVAAALVALIVAVVLPPTRVAIADAVAGLLRFAGVSIATAPAPTPPGGTASPLPGQRAVALDEAQRAVRFPIRLPARLGPPERVLVAGPDATGRYRVATLLYDGGALRVDAFDGRLNLSFHKEVIPPGAEWVQVNGDFAVWVDGPHVLSYVDRAGGIRSETARLAASTLIWQDNDVSYRLEGDLTKTEAIEIAGSLR
ncbi:hypothetical protein [Micromonospora ureilytica]|uniref:DNA-binding transcriptional ArsR family regulator n=1 Tax=Micromonospora ureilytica TaxID=709868 RepID=A0ABS0JEL7_9ACTN|nr:hypothetical protein [Micromonospora ureilytica]MBG6065515.1 DNA-binding transcriptional ArsR family regulator [Micromonospora ureilytica]